MAGPPVLLWDDEVKRLLKYRDLVPRLEDALAKFSRGDPEDIVQPVRSALPLHKHNGVLLSMPAYMASRGLLCTKILCMYETRPGSAVVMLLDPYSGHTKAVIDGKVITGMRTAAASAISAKLLMHPDAEVLAILGSGMQAVSHYNVFTEMFAFKEVRVWNHTRQGADRFSQAVSGPVTVCSSVKEAVSGADVIVTVTKSVKPLLFGQWVKPGAHVAAVGACMPDWRELDDVLMKEAVVYVDSRKAAVVESGDVILSGAEIFAELGDVINGTKPALREKTTVFKSLGIAVEDAISAELIFEQWKAQGGHN